MICQYCDRDVDADEDPDCIVAAIRGNTLLDEIICRGCRESFDALDQERDAMEET